MCHLPRFPMLCTQHELGVNQLGRSSFLWPSGHLQLQCYTHSKALKGSLRKSESTKNISRVLLSGEAIPMLIYEVGITQWVVVRRGNQAATLYRRVVATAISLEAGMYSDFLPQSLYVLGVVSSPPLFSLLHALHH